MKDTEKPKVSIPDGNAFSIIVACKRAARRAGWCDCKVEKLGEEMKSSSDYDHLLQTAMKYFDVE